MQHQLGMSHSVAMLPVGLLKRNLVSIIASASYHLQVELAAAQWDLLVVAPLQSAGDTW